MLLGRLVCFVEDSLVSGQICKYYNYSDGRRIYRAVAPRECTEVNGDMRS